MQKRPCSVSRAEIQVPFTPPPRFTVTSLLSEWEGRMEEAGDREGVKLRTVSSARFSASDGTCTKNATWRTSTHEDRTQQLTRVANF